MTNFCSDLFNQKKYGTCAGGTIGNEIATLTFPSACINRKCVCDTVLIFYPEFQHLFKRSNH